MAKTLVKLCCTHEAEVLHHSQLAWWQTDRQTSLFNIWKKSDIRGRRMTARSSNHPPPPTWWLRTNGVLEWYLPRDIMGRCSQNKIAESHLSIHMSPLTVANFGLLSPLPHKTSQMSEIHSPWKCNLIYWHPSSFYFLSEVFYRGLSRLQRFEFSAEI